MMRALSIRMNCSIGAYLPVLGALPQGLARLTRHATDTIMAGDVRWCAWLLRLSGDRHLFPIRSGGGNWGGSQG
jgi:hypothetical protein